MDDCCTSKQLLNYKPKGWRGVGHTKKHWNDQLYWNIFGLIFDDDNDYDDDDDYYYYYKSFKHFSGTSNLQSTY